MGMRTWRRGVNRGALGVSAANTALGLSARETRSEDRDQVALVGERGAVPSASDHPFPIVTNSMTPSACDPWPQLAGAFAGVQTRGSRIAEVAGEKGDRDRPAESERFTGLTP